MLRPEQRLIFTLLIFFFTALLIQKNFKKGEQPEGRQTQGNSLVCLKQLVRTSAL